MARGNQRDKAREKTQKEASAQVRFNAHLPRTHKTVEAEHDLEQKKKNTVRPFQLSDLFASIHVSLIHTLPQ